MVRYVGRSVNEQSRKTNRRATGGAEKKTSYDRERLLRRLGFIVARRATPWVAVGFNLRKRVTLSSRHFRDEGRRLRTGLARAEHRAEEMR